MSNFYKFRHYKYVTINKKKVIIKIYFFEIEKEKQVLSKMIEENEEYDKILEQSKKIDS